MFACLLTCGLASLGIVPHEERSFVEWMRETNQVYTGDEYHLRMGIWLTNVRLIRTHNAGSSSFKEGINAFTAMTPAEYRSMLGLKIRSSTRRNTPVPVSIRSTGNLEELDWREKGAVTPVKHQGLCGSCWAFATVCTLEGTWAVRKSELVAMSEQNLLDCDTYDYGCSGGMMQTALAYMLDHQQGCIMTAVDYPNEIFQHDCRFDQAKALFRVKKYVNITENDEDDLQAKCETYGPVAVGVDASQASFAYYSHGIYDEPLCSLEHINHAMAVVGFGGVEPARFWIVKNSYDPYWGEEGYIRMIRKNNQCGIAATACVPTE